MKTKAKSGGQGFQRQKLAKTRARRQRLAAARAPAGAGARRNDLLAALQVHMAPLDDLRPSARLVRRTTIAQVDRLVAAIADLGFVQPILVRAGAIVDGHVRVAAARRLGLERVPAIEVAHLADGDVRKLRLALNRIAELGEWDLDALRLEIAELVELDLDLAATGFSAPELDILLLNDACAPAAAEPPPVPDGPPVTRAGDLWQLGDHRILCGNALAPEAYAKLLEGQLVHAVLTDPPYNVRIKGHVSGLGQKTHAEFAMASGEMDEAQWQAFLDTVLAQVTAPLVEGGVVFAFMDWRSIHRLYAAGFAAGLELINLAVWYKEAGAMGALYRSAHELVAVFCKGATPRVNNVALGRHGRNRDNVWCAAGANRRGSSANAMLAFHATPKPVELCVDALLDVTDRGDIVLDAFLGSGTTLIAAEQAGRCCYGLEIDPGFVDVIIQRWQQHTGRSATLAGAGDSFAQVAAQRAAEPSGAPTEARHA